MDMKEKHSRHKLNGYKATQSTCEGSPSSGIVHADARSCDPQPATGLIAVGGAAAKLITPTLYFRCL